MIQNISQFSKISAPEKISLKEPIIQSKESFQELLIKELSTTKILKETAPNAAAAQQFLTQYIEEKKRKQQAAEVSSDGTEASNGDESDDSISNGKKILKSIFETTGISNNPKEKIETIPIYLGPKVNSVSGLVAQTTQTNALQGARYPRRRPQAPLANTAAGVMPVTPFQIFLDKAVDFFEGVSKMEISTDSLMADYVNGKMTLEELSLAKSKVGVAVSFAMTLVNQVTQTFKEIQNMQV